MITSWLLLLHLLWTTLAVKKMLHFTDVHLDFRLNKTLYFEDSSVELFHSFLSYAQMILHDPDYVLYTGDTPYHENVTIEDQNKSIEYILSSIRETFPHSKTIVGALGGSEFIPSYNLTISPSLVSTNPDLVAHWKPYLSESEYASYQQGGFYITQLDTGLYSIVLNTVIYSYRTKTYNTVKEADPFYQFEWLNDQLGQLDEKGQKVYIFGHIPPIVDSYQGILQWEYDYVQAYQSIISKYTNIILGQIFGHVHRNEYRLPLDDSILETLYSPLFTVGSISPVYGNNPSFSVWSIHSSTYEIMDRTIHATNISDDSGIYWHELCTSTKEYGVHDLSNPQLRTLHNRMMTEDQVFQRYINHRLADIKNNTICDDVTCRAQVLCSQEWWVSATQYNACLVTKADTVQSRNFPVSYTEIFLIVGGSLFLISAVFFLARKIMHSRTYKEFNLKNRMTSASQKVVSLRKHSDSKDHVRLQETNEEEEELDEKEEDRTNTKMEEFSIE